MSEIWFNGVSSSDAGVRHVERYPALDRPSRKMDVATVAGRNGDIVRLYNSWDNYEQSYEIYGGKGAKGSAPEAFRSIAAWLNPSSKDPFHVTNSLNYLRLEDMYEPDVFRLAYFAGSLEVENIFSKFGRATITFNCRPERFLKSGEQEIQLDTRKYPQNQDAGTTIYNPTSFWARPIFKITATKTVGIQLMTTNWSNGFMLVGLGDTPKTVYFDTEKRDARFADGTSANSYIQYEEPSLLESGNNIIYVNGSGTIYTGEVSELTVIPRWWTL